MSTFVIALFCIHAPRGHYRAPLLPSRVSVAEPMPEVPVPIPPDVLVAAAPTAEAPAAAKVPAAGDNPVAPAEEVSGFSLASVWLFIARFVAYFSNMWRVSPLLSWRRSPHKFAFLACVALQLCSHGMFVYSVCRLSLCSQRVSPSELVFRAWVASKVASWRVSLSWLVSPPTPFSACVA